MSVTVILRVKCDASVSKPGSKLKKKCDRHDEFEADNIVYAKRKAEDAGWRFILHYTKDHTLCPDCGPAIVPQYYRKVQRG